MKTVRMTLDPAIPAATKLGRMDPARVDDVASGRNHHRIDRYRPCLYAGALCAAVSARRTLTFTSSPYLHWFRHSREIQQYWPSLHNPRFRTKARTWLTKGSAR